MAVAKVTRTKSPSAGSPVGVFELDTHRASSLKSSHEMDVVCVRRKSPAGFELVEPGADSACSVAEAGDDHAREVPVKRGRSAARLGEFETGGEEGCFARGAVQEAIALARLFEHRA